MFLGMTKKLRSVQSTKGGDFCVVTTQWYYEQVMGHLGDPKLYGDNLTTNAFGIDGATEATPEQQQPMLAQ